VSKITKNEFEDTLRLFLNILDKQPNLISPRQSGEDMGASIARMAFGFINEFHAQKNRMIQDSEE
jgi:hypothetical protein